MRKDVLSSCWSRADEDAALRGFRPKTAASCPFCLPVLLGCRQAVLISAVRLADAGGIFFRRRILFSCLRLGECHTNQ